MKNTIHIHFLITAFALNLLSINCYAIYGNDTSRNSEKKSSVSFDLDADNIEIEFDIDFDDLSNAPLITDEKKGDESAEYEEPVTNADDEKTQDLHMAMNNEPPKVLTPEANHKNNDHNIIDEDNEILISQLSDEHLSDNNAFSDNHSDTQKSAQIETPEINKQQEHKIKKESLENNPIKQQSEEIKDKQESTDYLKLRVLNKISGKTKTITAPLNKKINFDNIEILVRKIKRSDELSAPETEAFIEVREINTRKKMKKLTFSGWMFMSDPAISAMEHPVYDIWIDDKYEQIEKT